MRVRVLTACSLAAGMSLSPVRVVRPQDTTTPAAVIRPVGGTGDEAMRTRAAVLGRTIGLDLRDVTLQTALNTVAAAAGVRLAYSRTHVPLSRVVSLTADSITVGDALAVLLRGTGISISASERGRITLEQTGTALDGGASLSDRQGTGTVSGRVTDAKTGVPLGDIAVSIAGGRLRTATTADGRYQLRGLPIGEAVLVFRRLGYQQAVRAVTVSADGDVRLDVQLASSPAVLDQVVTTVTGTEQRREVGNLIETVRADSVIAVAPVTDLSDVLNARVPGLQVFQNGGVTGASPSINIRGQNSFTVANQPLIYVDGVRVDNSAADSPYTGNGIITATYGASFGGRLNDVSPDEIQTIEIVKGPSAATLYGTDAANGVVLLTTKRGVAGPPRWDFAAEQGGLSLDRNRFPYSYYGWGHATGTTGPDAQCMVLQVVAGACVQDSVTRFSPLRDPATTIIHSSARDQYSGQVSGGSMTRYFLSGTYEQETAPVELPAPDRAILAAQRGATGLEPDNIRPNALDKASVRANLSTPLGTTADLTVSSAFISQENRIPTSNPWLYGELGPGYRDASDGWLFGLRPASQYAARNREDVTHFTGSATSTWSAWHWLSAHATTGVDFSNNYADILVRPGDVSGDAFAASGFRENGRTDITLYTVDVGATAALTPIPGTTAKTSVGGQYDRRADFQNMARAMSLAPGTVTVAGGAVPIVGESTVESIVAGAYAQEEIGIENRFFVTGALRADGASSFGRNFSTEYYPKASISWLVSDEPWVPHLPGVASLRLRAAFGASGVEPGPTDALPSLLLNPTAVDGGTTVGGVLNTIGNVRLKPERQTEIEGGVDVDLVRQRAHVEATYYHKRSTDALVNVPLPTYYGVAATTQEINIGSVQNRGIELSASATLIDTRPFGWSITVSGSANQNALLSAPASLTTPGSGFAIGKPLWSNYELPILAYSDANHDGIIEADEVTVGTTPVFQGATYPSGQVTYQTAVVLFGNVQLDAQVDSRSGSDLVDYAAALQTALGNSRALNLPRAPVREQVAAIAYQNGTTAGYTYNGSFTRLREVSVTYILPALWLRHLHARSASLTVAGRNLVLWTRYRGVDPEINTLPQGNGLGGAYADVGGAPPSRYLVARLRVGL